MNKIDKYIDKVFEQEFSEKALLTDFETSYTKKNWVQMKKALKKKAFLKFSLTNFNIYYLSIVVSAVVLTGAILICRNHEIQRDVPPIEKPAPDNGASIIDTLEKEIISDTISCIEPQVRIKEKIIESPANEKNSTENEITDRAEIKPLKPSNHCIQKIDKNNPDIIDIFKPTISSVDTIFNVDTIKVTKKKLILQKKN